MAAASEETAEKELKVPPMGESVTEATLAKWLHQKGDFVAQDQPLVELETDKVTLEVAAPISGILSQVFIQTGETVAVGTVLGLMKAGAEPGISVAPAPSVGQEAAVSSVNENPSLPPVFPAAKKIAIEQQVSTSQISGTGKGGRVTKGDVLEAVATRPSPPADALPPQPVADGKEIRVPMTRLRQKIAQRLKEAQNTAAILTTFNEIDMSNVMALREKFKDKFEKKHGVKLGFMSFFVHACVMALKEFPAVNAEIQGTDVVFKHYYDIGVAVGTPQGLVVPVLRGADQLNFAQIEKEIGALGTKAREGKLALTDLMGGTFSISNGGIYGSLMSTPILNPPQSAILGMHKIQQRPVAVGKAIEIRPMMYVALSYDHRIIDGREAVTFLVRVREALEDPERLMLEV